MLDGIAKIGHHTISLVSNIGNSGLFLIRVLFRKPDVKKLVPSVIHQLYYIGPALPR